MSLATGCGIFGAALARLARRAPPLWGDGAAAGGDAFSTDGGGRPAAALSAVAPAVAHHCILIAWRCNGAGSPASSLRSSSLGGRSLLAPRGDDGHLCGVSQANLAPGSDDDRDDRLLAVCHEIWRGAEAAGVFVNYNGLTIHGESGYFHAREDQQIKPIIAERQPVRPRPAGRCEIVHLFDPYCPSFNNVILSDAALRISSHASVEPRPRG